MATIEQDARYSLKDEDVLVHFNFEAHGDVPYGWHVLVIQAGKAWDDLMEQINKDSPTYYNRNELFARSTMDHIPDPDGSIGTMYFRSDFVYVGIVAHEVLHLASWMCRTIPGVNRRMTFGNEPEIFAEILAQLTAVTWINLEDFWCE